MPPYLTTVSLSSNTNNDHRTLDLIPGKSYTIGRASRTKQDMFAAPGNALFDCAVVSREHAELRSSPWQPPGKQVTLTDKKSLHGTTVNGRRLMPHLPFPLKTGDVIKFGEKVARGDGMCSTQHVRRLSPVIHLTATDLFSSSSTEAHDGVSVTFHQIDLDHHHDSSYRQPVSPSNVRGYLVPDDSEQSDYESEDDSFISNPHERSSAKTTPEQAKMGSQKQPIDLEDVTASHRKIISLIDEDEPAWVSGSQIPSASNPAPRSTVPESIPAESLLVPDSLAAAEPFHAHEFDIHDSDFDDDEDDDESVVEQNTGLSQILSEQDAASEDEEDDNNDDMLDQGVELVGDFQEDDHDTYSLEGSLEPSDVESEQYVSDNEESTSFVSQRQASEELGEPSMPAQKPSWLEDLVNDTAAAAAQKPRYDPVRSSQPREEPASTAGQAQPTSYTYNSLYPNGFSSANLATDLSGSTRWDLQPASTSAQYTVESTYTPVSPSYHPAQSPLPAWVTDDDGNNMDFFGLPQTTQTVFEPSSATVAPLPATSASKGKLSISNLLQSRASIPEKEPEDSARARVQTIADLLTLPAGTSIAHESTSTKRKASEVEDMLVAEPAAKKVATVDAATGTQRAIAVPARMRGKKNNKSSLVRRVAGAAVKYTASATFGAAATVAFLNSSYAEQLIQYLS